MIEIRRATSDDVGTLVEFAAALTREDSGQRDPFANTSWAETEGHQRYGEVVTDPSAGCFLAFAAGIPVGYISGSIKPPDTFTRATEARIGSLYVAATHRGQRVGELLVEAFLAWAREQRADRVTVSAFASNHGGLRFYERVGFKPHAVSLQLPLVPDA
jgi:GNAT superfamily N-acetyltransferase